MKAERLNRRITIQQQAVSQTDPGEEAVEWSDLVTVWANERFERGGERYAARQWIGRTPIGFRFRWSTIVSAITVEHRILFDGRAFDITDVREIGRRDGIEIDVLVSGEQPLVPQVPVTDQDFIEWGGVPLSWGGDGSELVWSD